MDLNLSTLYYCLIKFKNLPELQCFQQTQQNISFILEQIFMNQKHIQHCKCSVHVHTDTTTANRHLDSLDGFCFGLEAKTCFSDQGITYAHVHYARESEVICSYVINISRCLHLPHLLCTSVRNLHIIHLLWTSSFLTVFLGLFM